MAFLEGLSMDPEYQKWVEDVESYPVLFVFNCTSIALIPYQVDGSGLPKGWPSWARWTYKKPFLPKTLHSENGLQNFLEVFNQTAGNVVWSRASFQSVVLAFGMTLRDVTIAHWKGPGERPSGVPAWVTATPLNDASILKAMRKLHSRPRKRRAQDMETDDHRYVTSYWELLIMTLPMSSRKKSKSDKARGKEKARDPDDDDNDNNDGGGAIVHKNKTRYESARVSAIKIQQCADLEIDCTGRRELGVGVEGRDKCIAVYMNDQWRYGFQCSFSQKAVVFWCSVTVHSNETVLQFLKIASHVNDCISIWPCQEVNK
jgi:hypothetical protein